MSHAKCGPFSLDLNVSIRSDFMQGIGLQWYSDTGDTGGLGISRENTSAQQALTVFSAEARGSS